MNAAGPLKSLEHSGPPSECYLISKKDASGPTQGKKKKSKPIEILWQSRLSLKSFFFDLMQCISLVP